MNRLPVLFRISFGLACVTMALVLLGHSLGLIPNQSDAIFEGRQQLAESIALHCSLAMRHDEDILVRQALSTFLSRHDELLSVGLRDAEGTLVLSVGDHASWHTDFEDPASAGQI